MFVTYSKILRHNHVVFVSTAHARDADKSANQKNG